MCVNFSTPSRAQIESVIAADVQGDLLETPIDVWPGYPASILRYDSPRERLVLESGLFGLVPPFVSDLKKKKFSTVNARSETVAELATYKSAWKKQHFCLVPMTHYYDPNYESGRAVRWAVRRRDTDIFFVAGLWSWWRGVQHPDGVPTFTLLTVNADAHAQLNRLHAPDDEKRGLVQIDTGEIKAWLTASTELARVMLTLPDADRLILEPAPQPPRKKKTSPADSSPLLD